jgi:hypothetical protein
MNNNILYEVHPWTLPLFMGRYLLKVLIASSIGIRIIPKPNNVAVNHR